MGRVPRYFTASLALLLVTWLGLTSGTDIAPVLLANDTVCNSGSWVEFTCERGTVWRVGERALRNDTHDENYSISSNFSSNIGTLKLKCLPSFNKSGVQCYNGLNHKWSNNISLLVQGLLDGVVDLQYENKSLTWRHPYQLKMSQTIVYDIVVEATDQAHEEPIVEHNYTETFLNLSGKIEQGITYNASLWTINAVGRGSRSSVEFVEERIATSAAPEDSTSVDDFPTNTPSVDKFQSLSPGQITGIVLAAIVLVLLAIALIIGIVLFIFCRKKRDEHELVQMDSPSKSPSVRGITKSKKLPSKVGPDLVRKRRKI